MTTPDQAALTEAIMAIPGIKDSLVPDGAKEAVVQALIEASRVGAEGAQEFYLATLQTVREHLPAGHVEVPGLIRAMELVRSYRLYPAEEAS